MAKNERTTENLTEQELRKAGFLDSDWQFQGSEEEEIQRCLPSKRKGSEGKGKPEFLIRLNGDAADVLVIECKLDKAKHASALNLNETSKLKAADFAEDGVIHYMQGLKREYNVIGLAISGGSFPLKVTTFIAVRNGIVTRKRDSKILTRSDYLQLLRNVEGYGNRSEEEVMIFARSLHNYFRDEMELSDQHKPLIVSGILLALQQSAFEQGYRNYSDKDKLAKATFSAIEETLEDASIDEKKRAAMMSNYEFVKTHQAVKEHLRDTIARIYRNLFFALKPSSSLDFLGSFYGEFLRYSGGDQKTLGIVLTPRHITELFADLAQLDPDKSVVLDICAGSGGFLISAMANMIESAGASAAKVQRVKKKGLIGIEMAPHMFTLACANMILRGDGKANMFLDNCLVPKDPNLEVLLAEMKPNVAFLNPPYSKKDVAKDELKFVMRSLDLLDSTGGTAIAIIPVGSLIDDGPRNTALKKELLDRHTLVAVMSMPPQLFPKVGTVTAIVVFSAHTPHLREVNKQKVDPEGQLMTDNRGRRIMEKVLVPRKETWFGYWRDDGFMMKKNSRVERVPGGWEDTKSKWLEDYFYSRSKAGKSCMQAVTHNHEWVAEAYLKTDYSALTKEVFNKEVKKFLLYNVMVDVHSGDDANEAE